MAFEHYIATLSDWEKVVLDFSPGVTIRFTEDWQTNFIQVWEAAKKCEAYDQCSIAHGYAEWLIEHAHQIEHEPDWYRLTMAVGRTAGLLRVVKHAPEIYPSLRELIAEEE